LLIQTSIGPSSDSMVAQPLHVAPRGLETLAAVAAAGEQPDARAVAREAARGRPADSGRGSGDDHDVPARVAVFARAPAGAHARARRRESATGD
jgi:hypothetical protein